MKKEKAKYSVLSNIGFMLKMAKKHAPSVILIMILLGILPVAIQTTQVLFTPAILQAIEEKVSLRSISILIIQFTSLLILLNFIRAYLDTNSLYGRITVRTNIINLKNFKIFTTSYPNIHRDDFQKLCDRAIETTSSNTSPAEGIWKTLSSLIENFLGTIVYLFLLSKMNLWIILLTIGTTLASFFFSRNINEWGYRHREEVAEHSKRMTYITGRSSNHIDAKDIRMFNLGPWLNEVYSKAFKLYSDFKHREQRVYLGADLIDLVLALGRNLIAYGYLIKLVFDQELSVPEFVLLFTAVNGLSQWVTSLLENTNKLYKESLELSAVRELIDFAEPFKFEDGLSLEPEDKEYEIELRNLSFKYPLADKYTLKDINLKIRAGEKLAIVGLNGAGKTTLVKLIVGLYDPTEGEVLLNGKNIKDYNRRDIYKHFSAVFQNFSIMAGPIYENVSQALLEDTDIDKADRALKMAGIWDKVKSLPEAGETKLIKEVYEDAIELSGGETQRLMLARALYKDAPVLVLDEPTAALDPIAENKIYMDYNDLTKDRTSIFISHRLASTRFCDRIIFIGEGKILEEGNHDELVVSGGPYEKLFDVQARYYKEGGGNYEEFSL